MADVTVFFITKHNGEMLEKFKNVVNEIDSSSEKVLNFNKIFQATVNFDLILKIIPFKIISNNFTYGVLSIDRAVGGYE